jgi:hypothetical protein
VKLLRESMDSAPRAGGAELRRPVPGDSEGTCLGCGGVVAIREIQPNFGSRDHPDLVSIGAISWCTTERTFGFIPTSPQPEPARHGGVNTEPSPGEVNGQGLPLGQGTEPGPARPVKARICPECGERTVLTRYAWASHRGSHRPWTARGRPR